MKDAEAFDFVRTMFLSVVDMSDAEWKAFEVGAKVKTLKKREHFLLQGETCKNLGIITQGYVRHYYVTEEKQITNDFNFEGMITGAYHSFTSGRPARFNIIAMEDVTMVTYHRELLESLCETYFNWQKLVRIFIERLFERKLLREESLLIETPEQRYKTLIERHPDIVQRVPLQFVAPYLGMAPETLSRVRAKF